MLRTLLLAAVLFPAFAAAQPAEGAPPAEIEAKAATAAEVKSIAFGTAINERALEGQAESFAATGEVFAYLTLSNRGEAGQIKVVWRKDGQERSAIELNVGTSNRWRTWARRTLRAGDAGAWEVQVQSLDGTVLSSGTFTVTAP